jgi:hypothetical protein
VWGQQQTYQSASAFRDEEAMVHGALEVPHSFNCATMVALLWLRNAREGNMSASG